MIDFHSHILPYIDDGSKNFDMSVEMIKIAFEQGSKYICATPHFITGEFEISREAYNDKIEGLKNLGKLKGIDINILPGLEIYMHPDLPKLYREKKIWGLNDTSYLLIEFPMEQLPSYGENVFYELRLLGATPIIAHPERNLKFMKNTGLLLDLLEQGALCQLNAGSIRGMYGKEVKAFAETLVKNNMVHMIGSDAHNSSTRSPRLTSENTSIKSINKELYEWMMDFEYKVINGEEMTVLPVKTKGNNKKSFFNLFHI
jgi:protein-tyrosine phosphatase